MFLDTTIKRNSDLIKTAIEFHKDGIIEPDTYVLDYDRIMENAKAIKKEADKYGIKLYFMTKQIGRNPLICKGLMELGYDGAVVVDYREAEIMIKNNIKIGHIGHLVQIPKQMLKKILKSSPGIITVYSMEKAIEINEICKELGIIQRVSLKILGENDIIYPGQNAGFKITELLNIVAELLKLNNIVIEGITSFPCFLYKESSGKIEATNNIKTLQLAKNIIENNFNITIKEINMPSSTCSENIDLIYAEGGNVGEPGHGLTGTTPYHKHVINSKEIPAIVYVSEISHNASNKGYCYGGGHYRRSNVEKSLVGKNFETMNIVNVTPPSDENIDYYFELDKECNISDTVIMAFRTQIFVTRSKVCVVSGISKNRPTVLGYYDAVGREINE